MRRTCIRYSNAIGWIAMRSTPSRSSSPGQAAADSLVDIPQYSDPARQQRTVVPCHVSAARRGAWRSCGGCDDAAALPCGTPDQNVLRTARTPCSRRTERFLADSPRRCQTAGRHRWARCRPPRGRWRPSASAPSEADLAAAGIPDRRSRPVRAPRSSPGAAPPGAATTDPRFEVLRPRLGVTGVAARRAAAGCQVAADAAVRRSPTARSSGARGRALSKAAHPRSRGAAVAG